MARGLTGFGHVPFFIFFGRAWITDHNSTVHTAPKTLHKILNSRKPAYGYIRTRRKCRLGLGNLSEFVGVAGRRRALWWSMRGEVKIIRSDRPSARCRPLARSLPSTSACPRTTTQRSVSSANTTLQRKEEHVRTRHACGGGRERTEDDARVFRHTLSAPRRISYVPPPLRSTLSDALSFIHLALPHPSSPSSTPAQNGARRGW